MHRKNVQVVYTIIITAQLPPHWEARFIWNNDEMFASPGAIQFSFCHFSLYGAKSIRNLISEVVMLNITILMVEMG